ncbi:MAG: hypothetical protein JW802_05290 [Campylobacterales bacterium]|nr:hypothetical protein [Campylobacterales bacterium]MBN2831978.1 hypothetical protein [Campylobacterales bacterium]
MKNKIKSFAIAMVMALMFIGCGGTNHPNIPEVSLTKQFRFEKVSFHFYESRKSGIVYHTAQELESILNARILELLKEKNLLSNDKNMNQLIIDATYERVYVGDATPLPSDALRYPGYSYKLEVSDGTKVLKTIDRKGLTYKGGFAMNLQIIGATLRDKKYELEFLEAFAQTIVNSIEKL